MTKIKCVRGPLDGTVQNMEDAVPKVEWRRFETTSLGATAITESPAYSAVPTVRSYTYRLSDEIGPDGERIAYFMYER